MPTSAAPTRSRAAANYNVAGGVGTFNLPSANVSRSTRLDGVSQADVDIRFRVATNKVLSGANLFIYAVARRNGNNEYRPRLILNANGTVSVDASVLVNGTESSLGSAVVVPGLNQVADGFIWLRAEVSGTGPTTIRVKAWADGQSEPAGWQFMATNSVAALQGPGSLALRSYLASGGSNAPVTLSFDDYSVDPVTAPPPTTNFAADAFARSVANGWGIADIGGAYTLEGGPVANYNVAGGVGTFNLPSANVSRSTRLDGVSQADVDIRFRVASNKVLSGANLFIYAVARRNANNEYRPRLILNSNGTVSVGGSVLANGTESSLGSAVVVPGLNQVADGFIWLRAEVSGTGPTTIRVKAWADGQSEPAGWQFMATNSVAALQGPGSLALRSYLASGGSNAPVTLSFDDYSVGAAP